jgi:hypothetical protein
MTWKVGQGIQFLESGQRVPEGPAHAVNSDTGETACGLVAEGLMVTDQVWLSANIDKCPTCVEEVAQAE